MSIFKTAGIICEYNPFHNGHRHQIEETKKATGCDSMVCAMSGAMVQRGDVAIYDKWHRSRLALEGGADLVIELPAYYVLQSARDFALGGVELLARLGVVDLLSFGSECGDIELLKKSADIIADEPPEFKECIEAQLASGVGYPSAFQSALLKLTGLKPGPNDTLAANYVAAIQRLDANMTPFTLRRDVPYHSDLAADCENASATAIRDMIFQGTDFSSYVPFDRRPDVYDIRNAESFILGFFRVCRPESLRDIIGMEPGLENRLISCAKKASSFEELVSLCVTKRYTAHRIRRVIMSCILGMVSGKRCDYVRVLGFNERGRELLAAIKERSDLTVVTKTADFRADSLSTFNYDILATDIAALCSENIKNREAGADFKTSPVIL